MGAALQNTGTFVAGLVAVVALTAIVPGRSAPPVRQPLDFNHKKHIAADWTCEGCHVYVDQNAVAGIPGAKDCVECHDSEASKHPDNKGMKQMTERLRQMVAKGDEVPWVQLHRTAGHVYFSHRRHVEVGELKCENCHGDLTKLTRPVSHSAFPTRDTAKMNWCMDCHKRKKVTTDCLACHQ
jgi:c(7)-type cytochrome triheme protein